EFQLIYHQTTLQTTAEADLAITFGTLHFLRNLYVSAEAELATLPNSASFQKLLNFLNFTFSPDLFTKTPNE
ncbi:MAG: hypothetical protein L0J81_02760, partial [Lactiplantibacillus plantarum]|nr:hypothetical protein [Lactiplantibacillus plantarum]